MDGISVVEVGEITLLVDIDGLLMVEVGIFIEVGYCVEVIILGRTFIVEVLVGGLYANSIKDTVEWLLWYLN